MTPKTITITPEMQERAAAYSICLMHMMAACTEAAAQAWADSAERHRTELGQALIQAIRPSPRSALEMLERMQGRGVDLAVATAEEEETCAE